MSLPSIIQATPEVALSTWTLARAVAEAGQLGVVSSAPLAAVLARRLQLGDFDGHQRRALEHFPFPGAARRVWEQFFVPGGKASDEPFALARQPALDQGPALVELLLLANFTEVFLAKEGHLGTVGLQLHARATAPLLPSLYGALLAGVDFVLVSGPHCDALPAALDRLVHGQAGAVPVDLANGTAANALDCGFDPAFFGAVPAPNLRRPRLLVSVDSPEHAATVFLKAGGRIDGFLLECAPSAWPSAGSLEHMRSLGLPFWLGGMAATRESVAGARRAGAAGLRVGTPFTFCDESALNRELKEQVLSLVCTDPETVPAAVLSAPLGPPLHVLTLPGTAADPQAFSGRARSCDVGYFRQPYRRPDGAIGYRCPGEPLAHHAEKGGDPAAAGRQICVCNSLLAGIGLGQLREAKETERALVPSGEDLRHLNQFAVPDRRSFRAAEVIAQLLG